MLDVETTEDDKMLTGLCYPLWMLMAWFLLFSAKPFVKYHAIQSLVVGLASTCMYVLMWVVFWIASPQMVPKDGQISFALPLWFGVLLLIGFAGFVMFMIFGWKAWQGQAFRGSMIGSIAERLAGL